MAKANIDLLAFNRGIISPLALARTDVERTRLSAETFTNFLPKTQGAMRLRPGSKYLGSSYSDAYAEWIEFVAGTNDKALLELTDARMRVWIDDELLARDTGVDTTIAGVLSSSDTGAWRVLDTGGVTQSGQPDQIPDMTAATTDGVTISASSNNGSSVAGWKAADDDNSTIWQTANVGAPHWWKVRFPTGKSIISYSLRAGGSASIDDMARSWSLLGSDSGSDGDTGTWTFLDSGGDQTGWAVNEKRTFTIGSPADFNSYRLNISQNNRADNIGCRIAKVEAFQAAAAGGQSHFNAVGLVLNAQTLGGLARVRQEVTVDTGNADVEHGLAIHVTRGPVTFRVGSSANDDDLISETALSTGYHSLSLYPSGNFFITFQSREIVDRIVGSLALESGGTVVVTTPWTDTGDPSTYLDTIRYAQSADVVFVANHGFQQQRIERRGEGRSWSVVEYLPVDGPFFLTPSADLTLTPAATYGNTTVTSSLPLFESGHVDALIRIFQNGQGGVYVFGGPNTFSDVWKVTGINDTGTGERQFSISVTGTFVGNIRLQRSFTSADDGFQTVRTFSDTGTPAAATTINDTDDNITVWYRLAIPIAGDYTSGAKTVTVTYSGGGKDGVARVTGFTSPTVVDVEVLSRFATTTASNDWAEGKWSDAQTWPSSVAFHEGRLWWFGGAQIFGSVSDDYHNFNAATVGDSAPINRTLTTGPVDRIHFGIPLLRLFIGTAGEEVTLRSTSLDEPLTSTNMVAKSISTLGTANLRAIKLDDRAVYVQRSGRRVFMISYSGEIADYQSEELTLLVPDLLSGITSIAVQRQPDTRIHFALDDGTVAIATYQPQEQVLCWSLYKTTAASGFVEKVMCLPGEIEDQVYYHVRRDIGGGGNDKYTKLLLHCDGADASTTFTDSSDAGHTVTANGDAQIDTAQSKFGGASGLFDGTGDYLTIPDSPDWQFGAGDFTIDTFFRSASFAASQMLFNLWVDSNNFFRVYLESTTSLRATFRSGGSDIVDAVGTVPTISVNTWYHFALVRHGSNWHLFLDGVEATGSPDVSSITLPEIAGTVNIGRQGNGSLLFNGHLDEFRVSKGIARWTEGFTPPTSAYVAPKRFLERQATEAESLGATVSWMADCAVLYSGSSTTDIQGIDHLIGASVIAWGNDTGTTSGMDLSPDDTGGDQTLYTVDTGGNITLPAARTSVVVGLPYMARTTGKEMDAEYKSTKLAYAAQAGTALTMPKRLDHLGVIMGTTHNKGLFYGKTLDLTGQFGLQPLPRVIEGRAITDSGEIFEAQELTPFEFPGDFDTDARLCLAAKAPRPCTLLAAILGIGTNDKI